MSSRRTQNVINLLPDSSDQTLDRRNLVVNSPQERDFAPQTTPNIISTNTGITRKSATPNDNFNFNAQMFEGFNDGNNIPEPIFDETVPRQPTLSQGNLGFSTRNSIPQSQNFSNTSPITLNATNFGSTNNQMSEIARSINPRTSDSNFAPITNFAGEAGEALDFSPLVPAEDPTSLEFSAPRFTVKSNPRTQDIGSPRFSNQRSPVTSVKPVVITNQRTNSIQPLKMTQQNTNFTQRTSPNQIMAFDQPQNTNQQNTINQRTSLDQPQITNQRTSLNQPQITNQRTSNQRINPQITNQRTSNQRMDPQITNQKTPTIQKVMLNEEPLITTSPANQQSSTIQRQITKREDGEIPQIPQIVKQVVGDQKINKKVSPNETTIVTVEQQKNGVPYSNVEVSINNDNNYIPSSTKTYPTIDQAMKKGLEIKDYSSIISNASIENELFNLGFVPLYKIIVKENGNKKVEYIKSISKMGQGVFIQIDDGEGYFISKPTDLVMVQSKNARAIPYSIKQGILECAANGTCGVAFVCGSDSICVLSSTNDLTPKEANFTLERKNNEIDKTASLEMEGSIVTYPVVKLSEVRVSPKEVTDLVDLSTQSIRNQTYNTLNDSLEEQRQLIDDLKFSFEEFVDQKDKVIDKLTETLQQLTEWNKIYVQSPPLLDKGIENLELTQKGLVQRNESVIKIFGGISNILSFNPMLKSMISEFQNMKENFREETNSLDFIS